MLKKLLKYELLFFSKGLIVFYIITFILALLTRLFFAIESTTFLYVMAQIFSGAHISLMINVLINTLMRIWVRFRQNFHGDESYLTHSLPVEKGTLYLAKTISALISMMFSVIFLILCAFIAYYTPENMQLLIDTLFTVETVLNVPIGGLIALIFAVFALECINLTLAGFLGMVWGHRRQNYKIGFSVLWGALVYVALQICMVVAILIVGAFNDNVMQLFIGNQLVSASAIMGVMITATVVYTLTAVVVYLLGDKAFKKGVNVD